MALGHHVGAGIPKSNTEHGDTLVEDHLQSLRNQVGDRRWVRCASGQPQGGPHGIEDLLDAVDGLLRDRLRGFWGAELGGEQEVHAKRFIGPRSDVTDRLAELVGSLQ